VESNEDIISEEKNINISKITEKPEDFLSVDLN
jgi:hypothetical protein